MVVEWDIGLAFLIHLGKKLPTRSENLFCEETVGSPVQTFGFVNRRPAKYTPFSPSQGTSYLLYLASSSIEAFADHLLYEQMREWVQSIGDQTLNKGDGWSHCHMKE